ncbi:hypothetical protein QWZ13_00915 [Reinekea marina]|nr:hypothetical protein [Reinekea marina]MDN3647463.1 hypothetical protein [Reinekea marina]
MCAVIFTFISYIQQIKFNLRSSFEPNFCLSSCVAWRRFTGHDDRLKW